MKSTIRKEQFLKIYEALDRVSPVAFDCGTICGAVCCRAIEGEDMGIYLLPGEEKLHDRHDGWLEWRKDDADEHGFPSSWKGPVYIVSCRGPEHCRRNLRPIQCRTFPLLPHRLEDGRLALIYDDTELPYSCPLVTSRAGLQKEFIDATFSAWKELVNDPLIADLVEKDSKERAKDVQVVCSE